MRKHLLIASTALAMMAPTFSYALTGDVVEREYNAENVTPDQPFGDLDISAAGDSADTLRAFLAGLSGEQLIELIQRCLVIAPVAMLAAQGQAYAGIPVEVIAEIADGDDNDDPDSDRELFGGVSAFDEPTTTFCAYVQRTVFGDESFDPGYMDAILDARTPD